MDNMTLLSSLQYLELLSSYLTRPFGKIICKIRSVHFLECDPREKPIRSHVHARAILREQSFEGHCCTCICLHKGAANLVTKEPPGNLQ